MEEDIGTAQKLAQQRSISTRVQPSRAHANVRRAIDRIVLTFARSPKVEHVRTVKRQGSAHASSGNHMPHAQCTIAGEGKATERQQRFGLGVADLGYFDERQVSEYIPIL